MKRIHVAAILASTLMVAPVIVNAAYYYEAKTTTTTAKGPSVAVMHAWVDGDKSRIEFTQGEAFPGAAAGSYLVTHDGGKTLFLVDPAKKTVSEIDLAKMMQMLGQIGGATKNLVSMKFTNFSTKKLSEKPGEKILGYPTTAYHYQTSYTMEMKVFGFERKSKVATDLQFNCSAQLKDAGFAVWLKPDRFRTGDPDIDKVISQQLGALDCMPLRETSDTTTTADNGQSHKTVNTTEVTTLRKERAPRNVFAIPADYQKTSLMQGLSGVTTSNAAQGGQSTGANAPAAGQNQGGLASEAQEAIGSVAKEAADTTSDAAKDRVNDEVNKGLSRLRGLFKH